MQMGANSGVFHQTTASWSQDACLRHNWKKKRDIFEKETALHLSSVEDASPIVSADNCQSTVHAEVGSCYQLAWAIDFIP